MSPTDNVVTAGDRCYRIASWDGPEPIALVDGKPMRASALGLFRVELRSEFDARQREAARQVSEAARVAQDAARDAQAAQEAARQAAEQRREQDEAERRQADLARAKAATMPLRSSGWSPE